MSVLIKGMTMPKKCGDCPCMDVDQSCCGITFDDVSSLQISMQGNCPLVEVPPHGRLIDADALGHIIGQFSLTWEYGQGVSDCWDALLAAPTIIEAEDGDGDV